MREVVRLSTLAELRDHFLREAQQARNVHARKLEEVDLVRSLIDLCVLTLYVSLFHGQAAPEGYTAVP